MKNNKQNILIFGLGYVGLPISVLMSKHFNTFGFDISKKKIEELNNFIDNNKEISKKDLRTAIKEYNLFFTNNLSIVSKSNFIIVCVPTPVNNNNIPDLSLLKKACKDIGRYIKSGTTVIFESTVYPGVTDEICSKLISKFSDLQLYNPLKKNSYYYRLGYSPERVNPGDKKRKIQHIKKIVAANDKNTLSIISKIYNKIINAGLHKMIDIKEAEAAKVIENIQRDVNIALINELSMIFNKLKLNTNKILNASSTKWNFHNYSPGLVGGHCIGIDPYYLAFKAKNIGVNPKMILAGRKINNQMSEYVCISLYNILVNNKFELSKVKVLIMGFTFKENCPDIRNTKVYDIYNNLISKKIDVSVCDPVADSKEIYNKYKIKNLSYESLKEKFDVIIIAVSHKYFLSLSEKKILNKMKKKSIIFDLKSIKNPLKFEDKIYWSL